MTKDDLITQMAEALEAAMEGNEYKLALGFTQRVCPSIETLYKIQGALAAYREQSTKGSDNG